MNRRQSLLILAPVLLILFVYGASSPRRPKEEPAEPPARTEERFLPEHSAQLKPAPAEPAAPAAPDMNARPELIAHAGGAVYGYRLTNSREALDNAYAHGHRFIEVDIELTKDGRLVLIHDWDSMAKRMLGAAGRRSHAEFMRGDALADLTLLDVGGVVDWLKEHPDCSIITDVKAEDNLSALETIRKRAGSLADNFIPQIYGWDDYDAAAELGYSRIILTLYRLEPDLERLGEFVAEYEPWGVTVSSDRLSAELLETVRESCPDTAVFAHTVDDLYFFETWAPRGLTGIYTNYFAPDRWNPDVSGEMQGEDG